ncbi:hypothetical protein [Kosakonia cowanii]|uniref:hypothetical protein n=1 Tax=Kosakonia cowanii TaxID=208223 RepID=UPI0021E6EE03|nr:hypothetical protein [Kosakonia cowanii]
MMDADLISYETLLATRDSAEWARWTMVAAWISAIATSFTLFFAYRALSTWREQEKTKVKLDFRIAIKHLKSTLLLMPLSLDRAELEEEREQVIAKWLFKDVDLIVQQIETGEKNVQRFDALLAVFEDCTSAWLATEHLFDDTELASIWMRIEDDFEKYINGEGSKSPLMQGLNRLTAKRFVFNSK